MFFSSPYGGSVKYRLPLASKTRSLGLFSRLPSKWSARTVFFPSFSQRAHPAVAVLAHHQPALGVERQAVRAGLAAALFRVRVAAGVHEEL